MAKNNEDGHKAITYLRRAGIVATAIVAIGGLFMAVDGRYQTAEAANSQAEQREEGDINNRIELIQLELKYLANKSEKSDDDYAREAFLRAQLAVLLTRLTELQQ